MKPPVIKSNGLIIYGPIFPRAATSGAGVNDGASGAGFWRVGAGRRRGRDRREVGGRQRARGRGRVGAAVGGARAVGIDQGRLANPDDVLGDEGPGPRKLLRG
jgi:hypothetical protein